MTAPCTKWRSQRTRAAAGRQQGRLAKPNPPGLSRRQSRRHGGRQQRYWAPGIASRGSWHCADRREALRCPKTGVFRCGPPRPVRPNGGRHHRHAVVLTPGIEFRRDPVPRSRTRIGTTGHCRRLPGKLARGVHRTNLEPRPYTFLAANCRPIANTTRVSLARAPPSSPSIRATWTCCSRAARTSEPPVGPRLVLEGCGQGVTPVGSPCCPSGRRRRIAEPSLMVGSHPGKRLSGESCRRSSPGKPHS